MASQRLGVEDRAPEFIRVASVFIGLSTISIIFRFWSRAVSQQSHRFWWDDWTALLAWIFGTATSATVIACANYGLGMHISDIHPSDMPTAYKLLWMTFFFFHLAPALIKFSALFLFSRIFSDVRSFHWALWVTGGFVCAWLVAFWTTSIFYCTPIHKFWDEQTPGRCIDLWSWFVACGLVDVLLDILILLLPMPLLWNLQCGRGRKISIFFAFVFGYLNLVPSIGRLVTTAREGRALAADFTYTGVPDLVWCIVEAPIGIISICIPSCFPLFKRVQQYGLSSMFTKRSFQTASSRNRQGADEDEVLRSQRGFTRLRWSGSQGKDEEKYLNRTVIQGFKRPGRGDRDIIHVQKDVAVIAERLS